MSGCTYISLGTNSTHPYISLLAHELEHHRFADSHGGSMSIGPGRGLLFLAFPKHGAVADTYADAVPEVMLMLTLALA